jgi:hypothetical protein
MLEEINKLGPYPESVSDMMGSLSKVAIEERIDDLVIVSFAFNWPQGCVCNGGCVCDDRYHCTRSPITEAVDAIISTQPHVQVCTLRYYLYQYEFAQSSYSTWKGVPHNDSAFNPGI